MAERQQHWGATVGVSLAGAAACAALALLGLPGPSAICAAGLLYWLARRVVAAVPSTGTTRGTRAAPVAWSRYDRRRTARLPLGRRILGSLRLRRRRAAPAAAPSPGEAMRGRLPPDPGARGSKPAPWRQRGVR